LDYASVFLSQKEKQIMNFKTILKQLEPAAFVLLAVVFTIGLMFSSLELPQAVDKLLSQNVDFLDVATGQNELTKYKTELFLSHYHIRLIGYGCLGLIVILIVLGFILEKCALASLGAIFLFLPVFGHFAATMFFLGGLGFLRFIWLPFLDISFAIMRLGDIVLLPYKWILDFASLVGINLYRQLPFILTGFGIFIFLLGVIAWMYGRIRKQNVTDFWIYRISRHPQYLGWIIWSYGVLFLPGPNMKQYVTVANTLPWLLATMIIIGVSLFEERKMKQEFGNTYESYRQRTSFLFPLPLLVRKIFSLPQKLIFGKWYPDRKREIAAVVIFYTVLCIFLSAISNRMINFSNHQPASAKRIEQLVHTAKTTQHRGEIRQAAASLVKMGGNAVDSLIGLLGHKNSFVRWYCADALGNVQAEKIVQPLVVLLNDPDPNVRRAAAGSLGSTGSKEAVQVLIEAFINTENVIQSQAARSLGKLGATEAVPVLIDGLKSEHPATVRSSAWALGEIGSEQAIQPLINCLKRKEDYHYFMVGEALQKLGSEQSVDAFVGGLNDGSWWIQSSCASALGEIRSEKGYDALIEALNNGNVKVRRAAVLALSQYPSQQTESALRNALNDEDWEVRMYSGAVLRKIQNNEK
jgi:HEAT repeat protein/protein-S-isoprenylcysteine O-methyltransferase Ste14